MVTSAKQLIANRKNAKIGGVKTSKGKSIKRQLYRAIKAFMELRVLRIRYKENGITSDEYKLIR